MYKISYTSEAEKDLARLKRNEPTAFSKAVKLIDKLAEHPTTGTGKPEPLSGDRAGQWSRRISGKHRLIYMIDNEKKLYCSFLLMGIMMKDNGNFIYYPTQ